MESTRAVKRYLGVRLFAVCLGLVAAGLIGCAGGPANFNQDLLANTNGAQSQSSFILGTPSITTITPAIAGPGEKVTITGTNFGIAQLSSSKVFFSIDGIVADLDAGAVATPSSWTNNSIQIKVPSVATTGPVMVVVEAHTFNELDSNQFPFNLSSPIITTVNPTTSINPGEFITITGANFGTQQFTTSHIFFSSTTSAAFQTFGLTHGGVDAGTVVQPSDWSPTKIRIPIPVNAHVVMPDPPGAGDLKIVLGLGARNQRASSSAQITPTSLPFSGVTTFVLGTAPASVIGTGALALDKHDLPNVAFLNYGTANVTVDFREWQGTPTSGGFRAFQPSFTLPSGHTAVRIALGLDTASTNVTPNRPIIVTQDKFTNDLDAITPTNIGGGWGAPWIVTRIDSGGLLTNTSAPIALVVNPLSGLARIFVKQVAAKSVDGYVASYQQTLTGQNPTFGSDIVFEQEGANPPINPPDHGLDIGNALSAAITIPPQGTAAQAIIGVSFTDPQPNANFLGRVLYQVSNADGKSGSYLVAALGILGVSTMSSLVPPTVVGIIGKRTATVFNGPSKSNVVVFATHQRKGSSDTDLVALQPAAGKDPDNANNWIAKLVVQTSLDPTADISAAAGAFGRIIVAYKDKGKGITIGQYNPVSRTFVIIAQPVSSRLLPPGNFASAAMTTAQKAVVYYEDPSFNIGTSAAFIFTEP